MTDDQLCTAGALFMAHTITQKQDQSPEGWSKIHVQAAAYMMRLVVLLEVYDPENISNEHAQEISVRVSEVANSDAFREQVEAEVRNLQP